MYRGHMGRKKYVDLLYQQYEEQEKEQTKRITEIIESESINTQIQQIIDKSEETKFIQRQWDINRYTLYSETTPPP
jgi:hypothetical protein